MSELGDEGETPHWLDEPGNIALVLLAQGAVAFGLGLALWWGSGRDVAAFLGFGLHDLAVAGLTCGILIGSMQAIVVAFPRFLAWAAEQQHFVWAHKRPYRPAHILLISAAAGLGEEALFRGGVQTVLGDHLPVWTAILLASLIFTALHIGAGRVKLFIFALSLLFGIVYHLTGSLTGVIVAHAGFDIWALTLVQRELARQGYLGGSGARSGSSQPSRASRENSRSGE